MNIGDFRLQNKYILAPMAGITDLPFRLLCKEQGCGLVTTEMISAKGLYYKDQKTKMLMKTSVEEGPVAIQIFGSDPKVMSDAVKEHINDLEFNIIDINAGCPAPKIVKNQDGSALMKNPDLIGEIIYNIVKITHIPVTIKIRAGWDKNNINAVEVAKIAQEAGAQAITVHGRTRDQFYTGLSDWQIIREVKENVTIPVIGNGDIKSYEDARSLLDSTKCDGIMVGRAALGNPWIFSNLIKESDDSIEDSLKIQTAIRHMNLLLSIKPEKVVVGEIRKHVGWYTKGLRGSADLRNSINKTSTVDEVIDMLNDYLQSI
ncbi:tRNA dihydrouridine synthase DusB [Alkalibaculum sp. M08DMB]|uniref:tRNA-dihydrouridine synthase n=1 Tax=Alkalibaculum sporogenes TaxID=2655001 RepID=A0A6A7KCU5_9FIRM|nr:tRNA dihydrouridine synthase DusB [Alkalibaculum sporogenes]MPW27175.1 tRNA dihydrouridine synthase DusB [Alkalibaculum sporogenes]